MLNFKLKAKLKLKHLHNPEELLREAKDIFENPPHLKLTHGIHFAFTSFSTILLLIIIAILIRYRLRIIDLLCKPRQIIKIEATPMRPPVPKLPELNEDVQC